MLLCQSGEVLGRSTGVLGRSCVLLCQLGRVLGRLSMCLL